MECDRLRHLQAPAQPLSYHSPAQGMLRITLSAAGQGQDLLFASRGADIDVDRELGERLAVEIDQRHPIQIGEIAGISMGR